MNISIQGRIELTKQTIQTKLDSFVTDAKTGLYNELFLKEYLCNMLIANQKTNTQPNIYLLVIYIDNIQRINVKYSNKVGDETIKNLGYLLQQNQSDNDMIIKAKGPGYIMVVHDYPKQDIKSYATTFQNAVKNSDAFIESITVSTAIIHISEINPDLDQETRVNIFLNTAIERINLALELPDGANIDKDTVISKHFLGSLLVIESNPLSASITKEFFERRQYQVTITSDGLSGLQLAQEKHFDAIIVDRFSYKLDGVSIKKSLNESSANIDSLFILVVHSKDPSIIQKANLVDIDYVVSRPIIYEEILGILRREAKKRARYYYDL